MADQAVAEKVQEMFDKLLGDKAEAEAFSEDPGAWVTENGYGDLPADAVAECGVQYGSGASAVASSGGGGYASGAVGVAQAAAPSVYNTYVEDNSITNNLAANGDINFDQNVIQGDDNVLADDGGVAVGGDVDDSQIQTGSGIQAGDDVDIDDSAVNTGEGGVAIDDSTIDDSNINTGDAGGDINQAADIDDSQVAQGGEDTTQVDVDLGP
ncbi:MAG: hypothetical protein ACT4PI_03590 [Actinomycetota bacterium]